MPANLDSITFLTGDFDILFPKGMVKVLPPFSETAITFLEKLSKEILKDSRTKNFSDVTSYAFWIRKASIEKNKQFLNINTNRIGRGIAFHIAPSNVPVNFAVSFTYSLLAGNMNIVRVSNKNFEQVNIICDSINKICKQITEIKNLVNVIRYEHNEEITQAISDICDIRVVWGGNNTINSIRKAQLPPRAIELTFADRHSFLIINADKYLQMNPDEIAQRFYIDTYYTDQNACSSPRLVVWTGSNTKKAKEIFWNSLEKLVKNKYSLTDIQAVDKLDKFCQFAISHKKIKIIQKSNYLLRVEINEVFEDLMDFKGNSGYFYEYSTNNLFDLSPLLTKPCQTISYCGIEKKLIRDFIFKLGCVGVDRIVEIGKTMEESFIWDGYNMIEAMSRIIYLR